MGLLGHHILLFGLFQISVGAGRLLTMRILPLIGIQLINAVDFLDGLEGALDIRRLDLIGIPIEGGIGSHRAWRIDQGPGSRRVPNGLRRTGI